MPSIKEVTALQVAKKGVAEVAFGRVEWPDRRAFCPVTTRRPMVRWIAFDDESAEAVVSRFRRGAAEIQQGDAIGSALALDRPSRVLLPADGSGRVLVANFHPKTAAPSKSSSPSWRRPRSA